MIIKRFTDRIQRLFVLRFNHDRKNDNFLKDLKFVGEKKIAEIGFSEVKKIGRKLYEYSTHIASINNQYTINLRINNHDWPFPDKIYKSMGYTVHGFSFRFKYALPNIDAILNLTKYLINAESGTEDVENTLTDEIFYLVKKDIREKIKEYNAIPTKVSLMKVTFYTTKATE